MNYQPGPVPINPDPAQVSEYLGRELYRIADAINENASNTSILYGVGDSLTGAVSASYGQLLLIDPTSATATVSLPNPAAQVGGIVSVKNNTDSVANPIIVSVSTGADIDGTTTYTMQIARISSTFASDGTDWVIT